MIISSALPPAYPNCHKIFISSDIFRASVILFSDMQLLYKVRECSLLQAEKHGIYYFLYHISDFEITLPGSTVYKMKMCQ